jgi:hypothetical protein
VSAALLAVRLYAAAHVGFGDSEALYAAYARHPAPAYLDHPGLVGVVAALVGGGTSPSPLRAHLVTALLATAYPWLMALTCRACGASTDRSLAAALVVAVVPEMAIGLFALTPDLLLAFAWTSSLALAAIGLRARPGSGRATAAFAGAGLLAGVAAASKVTGLALMASLAVTYGGARLRERAVPASSFGSALFERAVPASSFGSALFERAVPWAGLAAGAVVLAPVVAFEARTGWPMLRHRLVDTQAGAGPSLRNIGALLGGQLLYLSPLVAWLAVDAFRRAWRARGDDVGRLLWTSCALPLAVTVPLCLWSRVAEPHWVAPGLLALVPAAARARGDPRVRSGPLHETLTRRSVAWACAVAAAAVIAVHAWVLVPDAVRLAPSSYDPRWDLGNELYGWPEVVAAVRDDAHTLAPPGGLTSDDLVVAGPHWVICAQLDAALRGELPVGCDTPIRDDFDDWRPRARWRKASFVLWVHDARFDVAPPPTHSLVRTREVRIERGGRTVRVFSISVLARQAQA